MWRIGVKAPGFSRQELDKLIDYSLSIMQNEQPLNFVNPKEINKEGILTYPPSEIDLRLKAISDWNKELLIRGPNQGMNHGSIYKQGPSYRNLKNVADLQNGTRIRQKQLMKRN